MTFRDRATLDIPARDLATCRLRTTAAGALLTVGLVVGLTACNPGAQNGPYHESPTPTPTPTPTESIFPTPVPTTVDESGTLDG